MQKAIVVDCYYSQIRAAERNVIVLFDDDVSSRLALARVRDLDALLQRDLDRAQVTNKFVLALIMPDRIKADTVPLEWYVIINYNYASTFLNSSE